MVQVLLECGVDVNSNNMFSCNPFYPSHEGHRIDPRVAQLLIAHGADPNILGREGFTPLHRASISGRIEIVRLLIEYGTNVEVKDDKGRTPLDVAWSDDVSQSRAGKQREEIVKLLLEHLAK